MQPQIADTGRQRAQKRPADETELEAEQPPFVAAHELLRGFDGRHRAHAGVLIENVGRHCVAVGCDDAGDDEQQRPERDEDGRQKVQQEPVAEAAKLRE